MDNRKSTTFNVHCFKAFECISDKLIKTFTVDRGKEFAGYNEIEMEVSLIFSCINLKKLANWMWKDTSNNLRLTPIFNILSLKIFIKKKTVI